MSKSTTAKGILDDIIDQLNNEKKSKSTLSWTQPLSQGTQQVKQQYVQAESQQNSVARQFELLQPQQAVEQNFIQQPSSYANLKVVEQDISVLRYKIQQLNPMDMQVAHSQLSELVQQMEAVLQQLASQQQFASQQQQIFTQPRLYNQPQPPQLQQLQQKLRQPYRYPHESSYARSDDTFQGQNLTKVQRVTSEHQRRFFWLQQVGGVYKIFWAAAQNETATGSMSLQSVNVIIAGNLSQQFVKCKISQEDIKSIKPIKYSGQEVPLMISLVADKRDVTMLFETAADMELWVAAVEKFAQPTQIKVLIE